jgi:RNA-binding protein
MKRVGEVVRVAQGLAIARVSDDDPPRMGATVVDENLDEIGRVVDVFGPASRPYVAVSPDSRDPALLLGEKLYAR